MLAPRTPHNPSPYDDDWEGEPAQSWFHQYVLGIVIPMLILAYAARGFWLGRVTMGGDGTDWTFTGPSAMALSISNLAVGVFLHCHYFWGSLYHLSAAATLAKIASLLAFIGALGYVIVRSFVR